MKSHKASRNGSPASGLSFKCKQILSVAGLLVIANSFTCAHAAPSAQTNAGKIEKVLVLHQKHRWLGKVIVYCNDSHVRVASTESEAALVANAPSWKVQIYDPQRKLIYEASRDKFFDSGFTGPFQESGLVHTDLKLVNKGMLGTMPGNRFTYKLGPRATFWTLRSSISGVSCQVLQALYQCPPAPGIPLALELENAKKRSGSDNIIFFAEGGGVVLSTSRCEPGTIASAKFDYVSGYKKARFATDVLVNPKIKEDMEAGLSDFGLGLGKTK
jgi:hypothetical protein